MTAHRKKPFLAVVDGTVVPPPVKAPRKAKRTPADREGTAISAAHTIEQLLPAYAELNHVWAIGTNKASAYHDANVTSEDERFHRVPCAAAGEVEAIRELSGANAAQRAMTALHSTMHTMSRLIQVAPVSTMEGLRAKTLAAMWECMPGIAEHVGFDFGDDNHPVEMLFRACVRVTGLSELADSLEARLGKDGKA